MTRATPTVGHKPPIADLIATAIPPIEIYDIGAMLEGQERFAGLVNQGLASVNGFEPNPVEYEKLRAWNAPRRRYFPYFLGQGAPATFHATRYPGCSSLYEPNPAMIDLFQDMGTVLPDGNFVIVGTERVNTVRLDDVPGLPPCDYMKLDVQGAELDVLRGGMAALAKAVVLEAEVEFVPLYKNQPLFGHIQAFLHDQGFVLHKFIDITGRTLRPWAIAGNVRAAMSQVLWADAVFVRNYAAADLYSDEQLLKAAAILYDVYNSHDLAHYLLRQYDQRRGTALADTFGQAVAAIANMPVTYMNLKT